MTSLADRRELLIEQLATIDSQLEYAQLSIARRDELDQLRRDRLRDLHLLAIEQDEQTRCPGGWLICDKHGEVAIVAEGTSADEAGEPTHFAELACGCVVLDPVCPVVCEQHGEVEIVDEKSVSGFTGAPIYLCDLSCGCQLVDASADNLGAAE